MTEFSPYEKASIEHHVFLVGRFLDHSLREEGTSLRSRIGTAKMLFQYLPEKVTALDVDGGLVEREHTLAGEELGETWKFSDVDRYIASLAGKVNVPWEPRFQ